jgi:hypothetical protein
MCLLIYVRTVFFPSDQLKYRHFGAPFSCFNERVLSLYAAPLLESTPTCNTSSPPYEKVQEHCEHFLQNHFLLPGHPSIHPYPRQSVITSPSFSFLFAVAFSRYRVIGSLLHRMQNAPKLSNTHNSQQTIGIVGKLRFQYRVNHSTPALVPACGAKIESVTRKYCVGIVGWFIFWKELDG